MPGLRLTIRQDGEVKIGSAVFRVAEIRAPDCFTLERRGAMISQYECRMKTKVEILPDVFVTADRSDRMGTAAMFIVAPPSIPINRL